MAVLFVSLIYLGLRLDNLKKHLQVAVNQSMINTAIIMIIAETLVEKKLLKQSDLIFLKQEEELLKQTEEPKPKT